MKHLNNPLFLRSFPLIIACLIIFQDVRAQTDGVVIDYSVTPSREPKAIFQLNSTQQGAILPRMSATQRGAINPPATAEGMIVYQTDGLEGYYYWDGASWLYLASSSGSGFVENRSVNSNLSTGQSASFDVSGSGEIGGTLAVNGNVGIGTLPSTKLDVMGLSYLFNGTAEALQVGRGTSEHLSVEVGDYDGYLDYEQDADGNGAHTFYLRNNALGTGDNDIRFQTSLTDRLIISDDGNVGIGANAPLQKLDVDGKIFTRGGGSSASITGTQYLMGYNGGNSYQHAIKTRHRSSQDANNAIDFYVWDQGTDAATAEPTKRVMTIDGNGTGSVGIGTEVPDYTLEVNGTAGFNDYLYHNDDADTYILFTDNLVRTYAGNVRSLDVANDEVVINEGSADVDLRVESNGNANMLFVDGGNNRVGIGAAPSVHFDVSGTSGNGTPMVLFESTTAATSWNQPLHVMMPNLGVGGKNMIAFGKTYADGNNGYIYYQHETNVDDRFMSLGFYGANDMVTIGRGTRTLSAVSWASNGTAVIGAGNNVGSLTLVAGSGGAFTGTGRGVAGFSTSATTGTIRAGGYFQTNAGGSYAYVGMITAGNVARKIEGNGTVNTTVRDLNNNMVVMSCPEAPENLFEDYGKGTLVNGFAHITIDPVFAKNIVVNDEHILRVFVQLEGDCNGVFVSNKSQNGFDVSELAGGHSNTPFVYHIVANRADEILPDGTLSKFSSERFAPAMGLLPTNSHKSQIDQ